MHRHAFQLLSIALCLGIIATSAGCEKKDQKELQDQIVKTVTDLKSQAPDPIKEVEKLHQLEYEVVSFPLNTPPAALDAALDEMGKNRWDCFHIERGAQLREEEGQDDKREVYLMVFCKRLPDTLLRYVPRNIIGR